MSQSFLFTVHAREFRENLRFTDSTRTCVSVLWGVRSDLSHYFNIASLSVVLDLPEILQML